jgi:hypothetical protein
MAKKKVSAAQKAVAALQAKRKERELNRDINFVHEAQPGCHVACGNHLGIVGLERASINDCPDILVDPETHMLSVYNGGKTTRSFYLSFEYILLDKVC